MEKQLFDRTISSISYNQVEIISDIRTLFLGGAQFQCDATFGYGGFYLDKDFPEHCFDLENRNGVNPNLKIASATALPLQPMSVRSIILDPPFVITSHVESEEYHMAKYGRYNTITELRSNYFAMLIEAYRVLQKGGYMVIKCQNFIHGSKSYFIRNEIHEFCKTIGFKPVDEFILLSKNRFTGGVHKQRHARKFHSYFLIFQK